MNINYNEKIIDFINDTQRINRILHSALKAVDPLLIVQKTVSLNDGKIEVRRKQYASSEYRKIFVIGIGKASQSMTMGIKQILNEDLDSGLVVTKRANKNISDLLLPNIRTIIGDHPIPGTNSLYAADELIQFTSKITKDDLVICLISGGGSALVTKPVNGIPLEELQELTVHLLKCGATIDEINTIRKHLEIIKGGGLAKMLFPAQIITLVLSDVIGDSLSMIASGPTTSDTTSFNDAYKIIEKYHLKKRVSNNILNYLNQGINGIVPETVKNDDPILEKVHHEILGNNQSASQAGKLMAEEEGFSSKVITNKLQGNAIAVGKELGSFIREIRQNNHKLEKPVCLIAGGETTVIVKGNGLGGRNQELALACAIEIEGLENVCMVALATDGEDGATDAAGAIITGETITKARLKGSNPEESLANNDSYHFFEKNDCLIKTGSTGTNVNDLYFLFVF